jgi:hypothetical protein
LPTPRIILFLLFLVAATLPSAYGQVVRRPSPSPTPPEEQEPVRVFTEEVRLPVIALDQYGHYDPTLEPDDVLVLEDGVAQQIRSVRHLPANVLLLLDTGGDLTGLGGSSKSTSLTRSVALKVLQNLPPNTSISVMQFNNSVDLLQPFVRQKKEGRASAISTGQVSSTRDPITATDPTLPPGTTRNPSFGVGIRFDPAMKKQRKAYEAELKKSQQVLTNVADEMGGRIFLPLNDEQMLAQAQEAARDIGAEYVVTYRPKRPLAASKAGEYRRVEVASRRVGLSLRSRRGYVVPSLRKE